MSLLVVVPTTSFNDSFYFPTRASIVRPVWKSPFVLSTFPSLPFLFPLSLSRSLSLSLSLFLILPFPFFLLFPPFFLSLFRAGFVRFARPSRALVSSFSVSIFLPLPRLEGRRSGNKGWLRPFSPPRVFLFFSLFFSSFCLHAARVAPFTGAEDTWYVLLRRQSSRRSDKLWNFLP